MLAGTPAVESEEDTMKAIADLMSRHQSDVAAMNADLPQRKKAARAPAEPGLQAVTDVDIRPRGVLHNSVPAGEKTELEKARVETRKEIALQDLAPVEPASDPVKVSATPAPAPKRAARRFSLRVPGVRVTWGRIVLLGAIAFALFNPAVFVLTVVLSVFAVVGVFVLIGPDRVWSAMDWYIQRIQYRNPARAEQTVAVLDEIACHWDSILDFFPESVVDPLYMPDFRARSHDKVRDDEKLRDRLSRIHEQV